MNQLINAMFIVCIMASGFTVGTCVKATVEIKGYDKPIKQSVLKIARAGEQFAGVVTEQFEIIRNK